MDEEPRLTPEARAAIDRAGKPPSQDFRGLAAPAQQTEYVRGWNDAMDYMQRAMTRL